VSRSTARVGGWWTLRFPFVVDDLFGTHSFNHVHCAYNLVCAGSRRRGKRSHMFITIVCSAGYPSNTMKPTKSSIIGNPMRSVAD